MSGLEFLPVVGRELRVTARKRAVYYYRTLVVVMSFVLSCFYLLNSDYPQQYLGKMLFQVITMAAFWPAFLAGIFVTADCISSEKRQGTLGLLFLTNLKGRDVVIGKLAATSLNTIYAFIAIVPTLMLPLLLGGVTLDDFTRAFSLLAATLFISLSAGMLASSLSRTAVEAVLGTVLVMVIAHVLPYVFGLIWQALVPSQVWWSYYPSLFSFTPLSLLGNFSNNPQSFTINLVFVIVCGMIMLQLSGMIVERVFRDDFGKGLKALFRFARRPAKPEAKQKPSVSVRLQGYRRQLLDKNPIEWLVNREPIRVRYVWIVVSLFVLGWFGGKSLSNWTWWRWDVTLAFTFALNSVIKFMIALESPRQLMEDRRSGSLELILSTPITERQILTGYFRAVRSQFAKPIVLVLLLEILLFWIGAIRFTGQSKANAVGIFALMVLLAADSVTLAIIGLANGMKARLTQQTAWRGVLLVMVVPWLALLTVTIIARNLMWRSYQYGTYHYTNTGEYVFLQWLLEPENLFACGMMACLVFNIILILRARKRLRGSLRELATKSYAGA